MDRNLVSKELVDLVEKYIITPSDISEHLSTLMELADGLDVVEFGTRNGISTAALLLAAKTFVSYDIEPRVDTWLEKFGANLICADDLEIEPVQCDMLFIDTHHSYQQLLAELKRHAEGVKKTIAIHDTISFGFNDQEFPEGKTSHLPLTSTIKKGLITAIDDFLPTVEGAKWKIEKIYTHNNGLHILKRR